MFRNIDIFIFTALSIIKYWYFVVIFIFNVCILFWCVDIVLTLEIKKKKPGLSYQILKVFIFHSEWHSQLYTVKI